MTESLKRLGYEDACLIGEGAFAKIYRVRETATGRFYACKISEKKEMLREEGRILQQLNHGLFPKYVDFKEGEEVGFLIMEYIPGRDLGAHIKRRRKLKLQQVTRIGMALAQGLCYLHELPTPIFFRDLKPENIMIREDGEVKLLDLGSAVRADASVRAITGTVGYAAPEQWSDFGRVGEYSDVYALGKVLNFLLGDGNKYFGVEQLLKEATREKIEERIPNMRCFMSRLKPYASQNVKKILRAEGQAFFRIKGGDYIFQQNIVKN